MSVAVIPTRRATARPNQATDEPSAADEGPPVSGFRMDPVSSPRRLSSEARQWRLRTIAGRGDVLLLTVGFDAGTGGAPQEALLPSDADMLPMDGTWRWLGLLSCWLSTALVASLLIVAVH